MNLDELVSKINEQNPGVSKKDVKNILKSCFGIIADEIIEGNDVSIFGFGLFTSAEVKERVYKSNGIIGEADKEVVVPAHKKVKFKPFKTLSKF